MINLEDILNEWKKDSVIDQMALDDASAITAKLHSKYLEFHSLTKLQLKRREHEQASLLRDKWLYFNGKMDKAEMDKRGWPYDPFNGLKVMKADMEYYFNADPDMQKQEETIEYMKTLLNTLEEIIGVIKWRHQSISNIIKWKQFTSGV